MRDKNIAFTIATGRSLLSAQLVIGEPVIAEHTFNLPRIYNNGVTIWDPSAQRLTLQHLLNSTEVSTISNIAQARGITPFINVIEPRNKHSIFHSEPQNQVEKELVHKYSSHAQAQLYLLTTLPINGQVTNISMIGDNRPINEIWLNLNRQDNLIAYTGPALEGSRYSWLDVHHKNANKGNAVLNLKIKLNASNIICFGDGDNDLSMFKSSDESYAPENSIPEIKKAASKVIGNNNEDGVAHFLRERFAL